MLPDGIYCLSRQYSEWLICYYCASGRLCQYGCSLISNTKKRNILPVWYILPTCLYMDSYSGLFGTIGQAFDLRSEGSDPPLWFICHPGIYALAQYLRTEWLATFSDGWC